MENKPGYLHRTGKAVIVGAMVLGVTSVIAGSSSIPSEKPAVMRRADEALGAIERTVSNEYRPADINTLETRIREYRLAVREQLASPEVVTAYYDAKIAWLSAYRTAVGYSVLAATLGGVLMGVEAYLTSRRRREESPVNTPA